MWMSSHKLGLVIYGVDLLLTSLDNSNTCVVDLLDK